jgi:hypothetical protein
MKKIFIFIVSLPLTCFFTQAQATDWADSAPAPKSPAPQTAPDQEVKHNCKLEFLNDFTGKMKSKQPDDRWVQNPGADLQAKQLYAGLLAMPGSAERKQSGEILQQWLDEVSTRSAPDKTCPSEDIRQHQITKKILQGTIDYLKAPKSCAPEHKVRLYRGLGKNQFFTENGRTLVPWSPLTYLATMKDQKIPAAASKDHRSNPLDDLTYKTVTQKYCLNCVKNMFWDNIIASHSGAGSASSPALSTSLEAGEAKTFASPYLMVLDVCVERALALYNVNDGNSATFSEAEVYLPFFALPEEVTAIVKVPEDDPFYKLDAKYTTGTNELTKSLRKYFFGKDLPFDVQYLTKIAPQIQVTDNGKPAQEAYFNNYHPEVLYNLILDRDSHGKPIEDWRKQVVKTVTKIRPSNETCNYAMNQFKKSDVFKMGTQPKHTFTLPDGKVSNAKFDLNEYRKLRQRQWKWVNSFEGVNSDDPRMEKMLRGQQQFREYFDTFENYHIVQDKIYENYLFQCQSSGS